MAYHPTHLPFASPSFTPPTRVVSRRASQAMADNATKKTDNKSGRRTSFARALHVPNIARRVRQFEQAGQSDQAHTSIPSRQKGAELISPGDRLTPKLSTPSMAACEIALGEEEEQQQQQQQQQEDVGGAEIPDIPLRRSSNRINMDFTESSLDKWERMMQNGQHPDPLNSNSFWPTAEKRYDAECAAMDDMSLYPVTERSWESSLPSVSEVSPESSPRKSLSHTDFQDQDRSSLSLQGDTAMSIEHCDELPASSVSLRPASPFDRTKAPSRLGERLSMSRTTAFSVQNHDQFLATLPPLQVVGIDNLDGLHPVSKDDVDSESFDLVIPAANPAMYSLEHQSELLFSVEHMRIIVSDPILLHRFSTFLNAYRTQSVPLLNYLLEALKAVRALDYVNSIISRKLRPGGHQLQHHSSDFVAKALPELTVNESLEEKTAAAFEALAKDDLPAYITHVWMEIVELSMRHRIMGTMPQNLQCLSEGLAEVFVITDPSRKDNPIVFASEEFHRTTQYGASYVMGRNCRFLQGPRTNPFSIQRLREKLAEGKEHYETFLNYRRDGLPFMNLLLCTPLLDSKGQIRYFLGAQIDVSGLAKDCSGLESLRRLVDQDDEEQRWSQHDSKSNSDTVTRRDSGADFDEPFSTAVDTVTASCSAEDPTRSLDQYNEFQLLAEMLDHAELETVRRFGGRMHHSQQEQGQHLQATGASNKARMVFHDQSSPPSTPPSGHSAPRGYEVSDANGNINISVTAENLDSEPSVAGLSLVERPPVIFENYLVMRPYPSLRILFASPSLRVPGMLQSHFMSRIGGSRRIHEQLEQAFAEGSCVTATVKWVSAGSVLRNVASVGTTPDSASGVSGSTGSTGTALGGNGHESIGQEGRRRWIHCTPLLGANGHVGVWVVVIVDNDDDGEVMTAETRRQRREMSRRAAPPVAPPVDRAAGGSKSPISFDKMSHVDFPITNRIPEDEFIPSHADNMYEDTRWRNGTQRSHMEGAERSWEKGWGDIRAEGNEEIQRSEMRARNEESQRSAMTTKSPDNGGIGTSKMPLASEPETNRKPSRFGAVGANHTTVNGDGTHNRSSKKAIHVTGQIERAMGSISSVRSNLLSSSVVGSLRQQEGKKQNQRQKQSDTEAVATTAQRKLGMVG